MAPEDSSVRSVVVDSVTISPGRMKVALHIIGDRLYTDADFASKLLARFPSLGHHACKNDFGPHFSDVIASTSIAHVLEHLIIDAQLRSKSAPLDKTLVGWTHWVDEGRGLAEIEVSFFDDVIAVCALNDSVSLLNELLCAFEV